jgi:tRNA modification GTPase
MDLAQAEAVMDLIHAQSERALNAARIIKEGTLGRSLEEKRADLINLLAHLEAYIDFPEEDISPEVGESFKRSMNHLREFLQQLIGTADFGEMLREGVKVAIVGAPNVGKSSLLNALLEKDRAIVSELPGTTRDTIEETMVLEGIIMRFIDTAGIREKAEQIEQLGIERTYHTINHADIILYCIDGKDPQEILSEEKLKELKNKVFLRCITKSDLTQNYSGEGIHLSSHTRQGLDELKKTLIEKLKLNQFASQDIIIVNRRHEAALREAVECLKRAGAAYENQAPPEIVSSDLRQAMRFLGEVVGQIDNEDILDQLFKSFCIGK